MYYNDEMLEIWITWDVWWQMIFGSKIHKTEINFILFILFEYFKEYL